MLFFRGRPRVRFILFIFVHPIGRHRAKVPKYRRGVRSSSVSRSGTAMLTEISAITYTTTHPMGYFSCRLRVPLRTSGRFVALRT